MNRVSLHKRSFRRLHFTVFTSPKNFRDFRETGTRSARSQEFLRVVLVCERPLVQAVKSFELADPIGFQNVEETRWEFS